MALFPPQDRLPSDDPAAALLGETDHRADAFLGTPRVLAIAGTGQNGATLLCRLAGALPGTFAVGEIGHLWNKGLVEDVACSCGAPFRRCEFWSEVGEVAFGGWRRLELDHVLALRARLTLNGRKMAHPFALPLISHPSLSRSYTRDLQEYTDLMIQVYLAVHHVSGAELIVDSMKIPAHVYMLQAVPGIDVSILHLVRDPRGVAFSRTKKIERQGSLADRPLRTQWSPARTASKWTWFNLAFEALRRRAPDFARMRYEDLVVDPRRALHDACESLALDVDVASLPIEGHEATLEPGHLVAGNRMRNERGVIRIRQDDAWRTQLGARSRRTVELMTSPLRSRYGYAAAGPDSGD